MRALVIPLQVLELFGSNARDPLHGVGQGKHIDHVILQSEE